MSTTEKRIPVRANNKKLLADLRINFICVDVNGEQSYSGWLIDKWEGLVVCGLRPTFDCLSDGTYEMLLPVEGRYSLIRKTEPKPASETSIKPVKNESHRLAALKRVRDCAQRLLQAERKVETVSEASFAAEIGTGTARNLRTNLRLVCEARDSAEHTLHIALVEAGLAVPEPERYGEKLITYSGSQWSTHRPEPQNTEAQQ